MSDKDENTDKAENRLKEVLVITKGHPYQRDAFASLLDSLPGINCTLVENPAAQVFFDPVLAADYDAFVFYDIPGQRFGPGGARSWPPPSKVAKNLTALLERGKGMVFLHHAIAGWPAWPEYAEIVGGRFLYHPAPMRGTQRQDSGYRHQVTHQVQVLADHPVTHGVPARFSITDELYLYEVFEDSIVPLLSSDYAFVRDNFYSATLAVRDGKMFSNEGWDHAPGSNRVGWVKHYLNSPITYLQCGDDPVAYQNAHFQTLLGNAIHWVASDAAKGWARARNQQRT
ncbi:MAG: ThuA domain-containing protein [Gammaproteobacteria bacterium]|nr:ThuA domain-containing protein [Gammaproteobacteria bacterium]